jgi:GAF domain-containing protein
MGVAIENARLFKAEQERVAELQIINSIQQGLAAELDFQAIVNLVGGKLREVLKTGDIDLRWYEEKTKLLHNLYSFEHGKRLEIPPMAPIPNGLFEQIRKSRQLMIFNTADEYEGITKHIEGTDFAKSGIAVPIISSDRVIGIISLENFEREFAFKESEMRLLTTIAASLGTALENARLFDETQRLLKETEQRNSELAVINSVQAALAAELNIQGIYDAVGDKIREIIKSDNLEIRVFDPHTSMVHFPYLYEKGERIQVDALPYTDSGFDAHVVRSRETLVINENMTKEAEKYGSYVVPGTEEAKSVVYVRDRG